MLQVELLEKLQLKSLAALSAASGTSADSDSDASTVKNVPVKLNSPGRLENISSDHTNDCNVLGQRKWKVQNMQFQKDLDSAKHVNSKVEIVNGGNNNNNNNNNLNNNNNYHKPSANNDRSRESPKDRKGNNRPGSKNDDYQRNLGEKEKRIRGEEPHQHPKQSGYVRGNERSGIARELVERREEDLKDEDDFDSCSCVTCNTCHQSDCSCSEMSSASQSSR